MIVTEKDDAAIRQSFPGDIYQLGIKEQKQKILAAIPNRFRELHERGYVHIHDLEGYGTVPNCCTPNLGNYFAQVTIPQSSAYATQSAIFTTIKELIMNVAMHQTGGIGFANFDIDIAKLFERHNVFFDEENRLYLKECITDFIRWINTIRTRYCREPYYITFNIGLAASDWGRAVSALFLEIFRDSQASYTRPNIVFKVNQKINSKKETPNYDIFNLALECSARRMIPTFLLTDSDVNKDCDPEKIGIMGCRTRVYQNINGAETVIGRGNIAYISMNLPRLALETKDTECFFERLAILMDDTADILRNRRELLRKNNGEYLDYMFENKIWTDVDTIDDMLRQGTYSFGFIGISETVEVLIGKNIYNDNEGYSLALKIGRFMREYIDALRTEEQVNYSLLATPGEMLSGRFCEIDKKEFYHSVHKKDFYTNSFHVDVDAGLPLLDKIEKEAVFHRLCNGGCITYIEFKSAPLGNIEALSDGIEYAVNKGISYLGFNYPLDICNKCGYSGTFDICDNCGSTNIKHIRRISGYLEDLNFFTKGKTAEEKHRKANA